MYIKLVRLLICSVLSLSLVQYTFRSLFVPLSHHLSLTVLRRLVVRCTGGDGRRHRPQLRIPGDAGDDLEARLSGFPQPDASELRKSRSSGQHRHRMLRAKACSRCEYWCDDGLILRSNKNTQLGLLDQANGFQSDGFSSTLSMLIQFLQMFICD